jgi:hypothetical protein
MAIERTQYITIAELNEILGVSTYVSGDMIKVYEASELLEYFMNDEKEVKGLLFNAGLQVEENTWPIKIRGKRA